jgi:NADPH:quinone reductase-like Zn-dependent oxidoreductase
MSGGVTKVGTWRNYAIYNQENLHPVPDIVPDEAAAQAIVNPVTAYAMLDQLNIPKGEYLLQTAAGSALGRILIQFANRRGVKTINLVRNKEQVEELKNIGADEVLFTDDNIDIFDEVKSITNGKLAYAAVDAVGGNLGIKLSQSVKDNGHILLYGALGGPILNVSAVEVLYRNIQYSSFALSRHFKSVGKDKFIDQLNKVFELFGNGVEPIKAAKFPLQQVSKALEESSKPGKSTKVLLVHS